MRQVQPGFTQPGGGADVPPRHPGGPHQRSAAGGAHLREHRRAPGAGAGRLRPSASRRRSRWTAKTTATSLDVEDFPVAEGTLPPLWRFKSFGPGYFETMGNRLVAGRSMTWSEMLRAAARHRGFRDAGARVLGRAGQGARQARARAMTADPWREIVGVVGDERDDGLNQPATAIVYWPMLNESYRWRIDGLMPCARRASARPRSCASCSRPSGRSTRTCRWRPSRRSTRSRRVRWRRPSFAMAMLGIAASVALLLGVVGIYGVIAYIATAADARDWHPHGARRADRRCAEGCSCGRGSG